MPIKPFVVLSVEDDEDDQFLLQASFAEKDRLFELKMVSNAHQAYELLFEEEMWPAIILLDINMPGLNGLGLLEKIRNDPRLKKLPVLMLTTSDAESHVNLAYHLGVNGYVVKPDSYKKLENFWDSVESFWLQSTRLPSQPE